MSDQKPLTPAELDEMTIHAAGHPGYLCCINEVRRLQALLLSYGGYPEGGRLVAEVIVQAARWSRETIYPIGTEGPEHDLEKAVRALQAHEELYRHTIEAKKGRLS